MGVLVVDGFREGLNSSYRSSLVQNFSNADEKMDWDACSMGLPGRECCRLPSYLILAHNLRR
jgi:hypothetical protein